MKKFKKFAFLKMFLLTVLFLNVFSVNFVFAKNVFAAKESCNLSGEKISRGRLFENNIMCTESFELFPEVEFTNSNGEKNYRKTVDVTKEFQEKISDDKFVTQAVYNSRIIFTYDKNSFVKIENPDKNIISESVKYGWSVMSFEEIFSDVKSCLVSAKCNVYQKTSFGTYNYLFDSHADVFCSIYGEIGFNTEIH